MHAAFRTSMESFKSDDMTTDQFVAWLVENDWDYRSNRLIQRLMGQLKAAKAKGTILTELKRIERTDLLILDDFGIHPFDAAACSSLMNIIEDRHGRRATIITSQVPVCDWHDVIGEKTIADAILDRIVHRAIRIELSGESIRKLQNKIYE